MNIGLIQCCGGNVSCVRNALTHLKLPMTPIEGPDDLDGCTHAILPGVGAFGPAADRLRKQGLDEALKQHIIEKGKPLLGICLGMQLLGTRGFEFGCFDGLNFVPGDVVPINGAKKLHMGWNELTIDRESPLFAGLPRQPVFYFVHGFHLVTTDNENTAARTEFGSMLTAVVQRDNVFGVQFHPEKSQQHGLTLLENFARL